MKKKINYFTPDVKQCLILGNFNYSPIQWGTLVDEAGNQIVDEKGNPVPNGFADLHHVEKDLELFREKIQQYGFEDLDIVTKTNINMT